MDEVVIDLSRERARAQPLEAIDPANPELFSADAFWPLFARLRRDDPIHWAVSPYEDIGGYWSVTRFADIQAVEADHETFSSAPTIVLADPPGDFPLPMFIAMDPPRHGAQRNTVAPMVNGPSLARLAPLIRRFAGEILDGLPIGETFDWVDKVSIELTNMTLATLFDFPWADRRKLSRWSDVATAPDYSPIFPPGQGRDQRRAELFQCVDYFARLWNERAHAPPQPDLISMLAHSEATWDMNRVEFLGNLILLIVGGNDTTRNTITGSVLALSQFPDQDRRLREAPHLLPAMVGEALRWQTPIAYMRRTATRDTELRGRRIRAGDKLALWYVSGNRDEAAFPQPDAFWIERPNARRHLSFGHGIHHCVGARLAELQLSILWEEILKRFPRIEVAGPPTRVFSSFVKGYRSLPVMIPQRIG